MAKTKSKNEPDAKFPYGLSFASAEESLKDEALIERLSLAMKWAPSTFDFYTREGTFRITVEKKI